MIEKTVLVQELMYKLQSCQKTMKNILPEKKLVERCARVWMEDNRTIMLCMGTSKFIIDPVYGMYYYCGNESVDAELNFYAGEKVVRDHENQWIIPVNYTDWFSIKAIDVYIEHVRNNAYLKLANAYADSTPQYTPARFASRIEWLRSGDSWVLPMLPSEGSPMDVSAQLMQKLYEIITGEPSGMPHYPTLDELKGIGREIFTEEKPRVHLKKKGINGLKRIYDKCLKKILKLSDTVKEGESPEFYTVAFPSYLDNCSVIIYTQIGVPENEYMRDLEEVSFCLTINPLTFSCKYSVDFPWADNPRDLFSLDPTDPTNSVLSRNARNALMFVMDYVFTSIVDGGFELFCDLYTNDPTKSGLASDEKTISKFVNGLVKEIKRNYSSSDDEQDLTTNNSWYNWRACDDGITIVVVGSVYIAIALDGPGLIDIAIDHNIGVDETWDDIFYNKNAKSLDLKIDNNFENVEYLNQVGATLSAESNTTITEMGDMAIGIMYRMKGETENV